MGIKEESLSLCLSDACCRDLPKAFNENGVDFWIKAIGCVKKCNGSVSYCLLNHRNDGMVIYDKDYGMMSPIAGLLSVHPYLFLDIEKFYMPVKNLTRQYKCEMICQEYGISKSEYENLTEEELKSYIIGIAVKRQKFENERIDTTGFTDFDNTCDVEARKKMNEDELQVYESRKDTMDEDGMITICSESDHNGEEEPDESEFVSIHDEKVKVTPSMVSYTSEGDKVVDIVSQKVAPVAKKRGRPRKNPEK